MNPSLTAFLQARDLLLRLRGDPDAAVAQFRWPRLDEFNWALDHFDTMARGNDAPALWLVDADGGEQRFSFAQLAARSAQVANFLRTAGVKPGDRAAHARRPARPARARPGAPRRRRRGADLEVRCGGGRLHPDLRRRGAAGVDRPGRLARLARRL